MKNTFKATLIAGAIAMLPFGTQAAGLGGINVFSGLGQPLRAEIELKATPQELQTLSARIASADAFRQANVTYSAVMTGLQVTVESRGNRSVIRLVSDRPMNEPFLELLVELNWANGRMLREYTFLLDPIEAVRPAAAAVAVPVTSPMAGAADTPSAPGAAPSGRYRVQRGDTLRGIANRHRVEGATLDQMLMALLRENPAAFVDSNINRLRAGAILTIPDQASAASVTPAQARREVLAQAADFEAYRSRLAGTVAARPADAEPTADRESVGEIVPRVAEPVRTEAAQDRVEVSGVPTAGDPTHLARLEALEEELVARERSLDEATSRLAELEQSVRDMQRLIELRNESLALLQQQLAASGAELPEGETALPAPRDLLPPEPAEELAAALVEAPSEQPAGEVAEPSAAATTAETPVAVAPPADVPAERPAEPPAAAPALTAPEPEPAAAPEARPAPRPAPEPMPQPTFLQTVLQDPMMLAGGGGILVLLLAYAGLKVRQRRQAEEPGEPASGLTEFPSEAQSVFGGKGGQSVDTGNSSVLHTDFSQSGLSAIDADEGVDPVAEADVYMAYGRDAQAEEILLDALKADPSRSAIYLKLLEIYAQRNSLRQFESVATDLYSRTEGQGADWAKAAEMGRKLDPENPLYVLKSAAAEAGDSGAVTEPGSRAQHSGSGAAATGAALGAAVVTAGGDALAPDLGDTGAEGDVSAASHLGDLDFTTSQPVEPSASQLKDTWTMPGDLSRIGQAVEEGTEADVAKAVEDAAAGDEQSQSDSAVDFSVLDFDLGGDAAPQDEGEAAAPVVENAGAEVQATSEGSDDDLVLDLGFDEVSAAANAASPADSGVLQPPVDASTESSVLAAVNEQFDPQSMNATVVGDEMDLALAEVGLDDEAAGDRSDPGATDGMATVSSGDDIDLTATMVEQDAGGDDEDSSVMDLERTGFDNSLLDFDFDIESTTSDVGGEAPPLDLSNIDLDLELPEEGGTQPAASESGGPSEEGAVPTAEVLQEVDTKLDLARAYEEMGDKEGARELIDEVLREGSPEQREAARRLLERVG